MRIIHSADDARQFLVERILEQSKLEGVELSPLERELLQAGGEEFELSAELLPEGDEVPPELERELEELDPDEYEAKVVVLLRRAYARDVADARRLGDGHVAEAYRCACERLHEEDHPMCGLAERAFGHKVRRRTLADVLVLVASAVLVLLLIVAVSGVLGWFRV
jgi:hypothetical protein